MRRIVVVVALAVAGCQAWPHGQNSDTGGQDPDAGAALDGGLFAGAAAGVGTFLPIVVVTPATVDAGAGR